MAHSVVAIPLAIVVSLASVHIQNVGVNVGLRIAMICLISVWLLYQLYKSYQVHLWHEQEAQVMMVFQEQLKYVSRATHDAFAQENVFVFDVVNYLQQVDAAQRLLTVGELEMLQACADEFYNETSRAASTTYI